MKAQFIDHSGHVVTTVELDPREFSTGSRGYFKAVKVEVDRRKYQVQVQAVEIGSKPK